MGVLDGKVRLLSFSFLCVTSDMFGGRTWYKGVFTLHQLSGTLALWTNASNIPETVPLDARNKWYYFRVCLTPSLHWTRDTVSWVASILPLVLAESFSPTPPWQILTPPPTPPPETYQIPTEQFQNIPEPPNALPKPLPRIPF
jgi:hypothetical protein